MDVLDGGHVEGRDGRRRQEEEEGEEEGTERK